MSVYLETEIGGEASSLLLSKTEYLDGHCAVIALSYELEDGYWDEYCTVSVNLPMPPSNERAIFLDDNNARSVGDALIASGMGRETGHIGRSGFCSYREFEIDEHVLADMDRIEDIMSGKVDPEPKNPVKESEPKGNYGDDGDIYGDVQHSLCGTPEDVKAVLDFLVEHGAEQDGPLAVEDGWAQVDIYAAPAQEWSPAIMNEAAKVCSAGVGIDHDLSLICGIAGVVDLDSTDENERRELGLLSTFLDGGGSKVAYRMVGPLCWHTPNPMRGVIGTSEHQIKCVIAGNVTAEDFFERRGRQSDAR